MEAWPDLSVRARRVIVAFIRNLRKSGLAE